MGRQAAAPPHSSPALSAIHGVSAGPMKREPVAFAFPTNFNQCSTTYAASVILGSGLTGILTDSANSRNAETGGFIGFRPLPNTHDSSRFGGEYSNCCALHILYTVPICMCICTVESVCASSCGVWLAQWSVRMNAHRARAGSNPSAVHDRHFSCLITIFRVCIDF